MILCALADPGGIVWAPFRIWTVWWMLQWTLVCSDDYNVFCHLSSVEQTWLSSWLLFFNSSERKNSSLLCMSQSSRDLETFCREFCSCLDWFKISHNVASKLCLVFSVVIRVCRSWFFFGCTLITCLYWITNFLTCHLQVNGLRNIFIAEKINNLLVIS